MPEKYHTSTMLGNHSHRLITNDLYLAAFLLSRGCEWSDLLHNSRRRLSFVICGESVHELRDEYESGEVRLNMRTFRDNLATVRRTMDAEQRSSRCPTPPAAALRTATYPMQLSPV